MSHLLVILIFLVTCELHYPLKGKIQAICLLELVLAVMLTIHKHICTCKCIFFPEVNEMSCNHSFLLFYRHFSAYLLTIIQTFYRYQTRFLDGDLILIF